MIKNILMMMSCLFLFAGCASNHMTKVAPNKMTMAPEQGKALVHFMRPSNFGGAIQSTVYNDTAYIGTVSANTRVAYQAAPGKHMFMVIGESADFLEAELHEGKTYYVLVSPRLGFWKARFSLNPASGKHTQAEIDKWYAETKEVIVNEKGLQWAKAHAADSEKLKSKYLPEWLEKTEERQQRLEADSGI